MRSAVRTAAAVATSSHNAVSNCLPVPQITSHSRQTMTLKESHEAELSQTHAALKQLRADKEAGDDELAALKSAHKVGAAQAARASST